MNNNDKNLQYANSSGVFCNKKVAVKEVVAIQRYIQPNWGAPGSN